MLTNYHVSLNQNQYFKKSVEDLISKYKIDEIIETGTCQGDGSTLIFAQTGLPVITLECDAKNVDIASRNLNAFNNVTVYHALSLNRIDLIKFIRDQNYNIPDSIMIDSNDPINFYLNEIKDAPIENLLPQLINNEKNQIIFLDSAGGVGYLEYQEVMKLPKNKLKHKVLIMDDVNHTKHYRSIIDLQEHNYDIYVSPDKRFGMCDFMSYFK